MIYIIVCESTFDRKKNKENSAMFCIMISARGDSEQLTEEDDKCDAVKGKVKVERDKLSDLNMRVGKAIEAYREPLHIVQQCDEKR